MITRFWAFVTVRTGLGQIARATPGVQSVALGLCGGQQPA